jgi:flagellar hook-length control protein FliK
LLLAGAPEGAETDQAPVDRSTAMANVGNSILPPRNETQGANGPSHAPLQPTVESVVNEIVSHLHIGRKEAVIRLDPPELGKIKIELRMEDGKLHAQIVADGIESRALIESHLPELRQALIARQIDVADMRVNPNSFGGAAGQLAHSFNQSTQGGQQGSWGTGNHGLRPNEHIEARSPDPVLLERGIVSRWA